MSMDTGTVICTEEHEMEYILRKYNKPTNTENLLKMTASCKLFKSLPDHAPFNRENFYLFLKESEALEELE